MLLLFFSMFCCLFSVQSVADDGIAAETLVFTFVEVETPAFVLVFVVKCAADTSILFVGDTCCLFK